MTGQAIEAKRRVRRGRPYWHILRGGEFFCACYSEAAVKSTIERLRELAGAS
jgi:hypothetical protein